MKFIIEHLEDKSYKWCLMEYRHISEIVGKSNLVFTNIKRKNKNLEKIGKTMKNSVIDMKLSKACILDPDAKETLKPSDAKKFDYLILGGILGDFPPKKRTKIELSSRMAAEKRNLGKEQMSTNTAVYVAHRIIKGTPIENIEFVDNLELEFKEGESLILPYRYAKENGKLVFSDELMAYLKRKRSI